MRRQWAILPLFSLTLVQAPQQLGTVHFTTSCSAAVQPGFSRAVALLHSFVFAEAVDGFTAVLRADPRCAIAYWGLALSAWGNPFAAGLKSKEQLERGLAAVNHARTTGEPTPRERGYIEAAARLYEHADSFSQRTRLLAYRDAMAELAAREPGDTEAVIFYTIAQVISADPADKSYASQLAAGATLEHLFAVLPEHPGLAHYIIHSYDVPALANRALDAAHRYARIAPAVSHALHMPSHTYTRVGAWQESITSNTASAAVARREASTAEELHADDYRTYAYLQLGQDRAAQRIVAALPEVARRLDPNAVMTGAPAAAGYYAIAAIPARYALERGAWQAAARLELQPSPTPFADAVTQFARALGGARSGDTGTARAALGELQRLRDRLAQSGESYWSEQVEIQRRAGAAWLAFAQGRQTEALDTLRAAAEREGATEKNAITPGPLAPAQELLGEMLLATRRPAEALAAFEATLVHEPNRFRALAGAARAARESGDSGKALSYYRELLRLGASADRPLRPELVKAARVVAQAPVNPAAQASQLGALCAPRRSGLACH